MTTATMLMVLRLRLSLLEVAWLLGCCFGCGSELLLGRLRGIVLGELGPLVVVLLKVATATTGRLAARGRQEISIGER